MRVTKSGVFAVVLLLAATLVAWQWTRFSAEEVIQGQVYRARQPSGDELCRAAEQLGLRTVINLRGARPGESWYDEELQAARRCGLERLDARFWTSDWPPQAEVRRLVRFLDQAETPVLLHCLAGVHRTGWASAISRLLAGDAYDAALTELSTARRTLSQDTGKYPARFFELYEAWLAERGETHDAERFRNWALTQYCPQPYNAELELLENPAEKPVAPGAWLLYRVRTTNRSRQAWTMSAQPGRGIRLGASMLGPLPARPPDAAWLFRERDRPGVVDVARAGIEDGAIAPGQSREFELSFLAPDDPGLYVVLLDMVEEQVHWFSELGPDGLLVDVRVAEPQP